MTYFKELEKIIQKFTQNHKGPQIVTVTLKKKNKVFFMVENKSKCS